MDQWVKRGELTDSLSVAIAFLCFKTATKNQIPQRTQEDLFEDKSCLVFAFLMFWRDYCWHRLEEKAGAIPSPSNGRGETYQIDLNE